ncbi:MAG: hypothetical protein AB4372_01535 [Xenococcus sp. (in: cyanobacteria)]
MRVKSYKQQVINRARNAFQVTALAYDQANRDVINIPSYWKGFEGRKTHRQNGEVVVGAYRNIRDLYNLGVSQRVTISDFSAVFSWDGNGQTPVIDVYFGRRTINDFIPGRKWTERALENVNLAQMFRDNF